MGKVDRSPEIGGDLGRNDSSQTEFVQLIKDYDVHVSVDEIPINYPNVTSLLKAENHELKTQLDATKRRARKLGIQILTDDEVNSETAAA